MKANIKVNYKKIFSLMALGVGMSAINFLLAIVLIKWLWKKIANILFPKLVSSGDVVTNLTFYDTFWIALFISIILTALRGKMVQADKRTKEKMKKDLIDKKDMTDQEIKEDV